MLHMILMEWFWVAFRVAHTSMGTRATIETDVIHPSSTSILANQCTLGAANRLNLRDSTPALVAFHGSQRRRIWHEWTLQQGQVDRVEQGLLHWMSYRHILLLTVLQINSASASSACKSVQL